MSNAVHAAPAASTSATSGAGDRPLRAWQAQALTAYEDARARDFLVTATPGAGKTAFALTVASRLLASREVDRVIVVCPTDHLRTQWADAASRAGILLDPRLGNGDGPVRPDMHGYVATYAQIASAPMLHRARTDNRRTLVVLDEIHHAGDGLSWGEAVAEAFDPARRRLALTGTPFRTRPDERIPFVRYEDQGGGELASSADYTYGYRHALSDAVVRPVVFAAYTGVSRWLNSAGEVVEASLTGIEDRKTEEAAWRTALNPRGRWVPHVIAAMDERLTQLREHGMPDAAGLVLASDQEHARAYAEIVADVTGEKPELILSEDAGASGRIRDFTDSGQRIAVCVRMISEGVDVPRAACLAWMTSYRTPLFFAQAVGRVVRARGPHETATVFLPAVRPLLALAAELESERNHVLPPPEPSSDELDPPPRPERTAGDGSGYEALDAEAEFAHVLHRGRAVMGGTPGEPGTIVVPAAEPDAVADVTEDDEEFLGLPGLLSPEQTATLLWRRDEDMRKRAARKPDGDGDGRARVPAEWEQVQLLRREVNALVAQVAARTSDPHAKVHVEARRAVPGPPSSKAPLPVLTARRDHLMAQL